MKSIVASATNKTTKENLLAALIRMGCPAGVGGEGCRGCGSLVVVVMGWGVLEMS